MLVVTALKSNSFSTQSIRGYDPNVACSQHEYRSLLMIKMFHRRKKSLEIWKKEHNESLY